MSKIIDLYRRIDDIHGSFIGIGVPAHMSWNGNKWYMEGRGISAAQITDFNNISKIILLVLFLLLGGAFVLLAPALLISLFVAKDFTASQRVGGVLGILLLLILGVGFLRRAWYLTAMLMGTA